jgi:hypothetical protein
MKSRNVKENNKKQHTALRVTMNDHSFVCGSRICHLIVVVQQNPYKFFQTI